MNFNQVFNQDNLLWRIISRAVDFVGLSLFWTLLSLPIITIGASTSALYYTVVKAFLHGETTVFKTLWEQFKKNLKPSLPVMAIILPLAFIFAYFYYILTLHWSSDAGAVMFVAYDIALIIPIGILCWLFPLMGRFNYKTKDLFSTAFFLTFRHLPTTIILVLLTIECITETVKHWWPIYVVPTLCALLTALFLERIFPKYLSDTEKKKFNR